MKVGKIYRITFLDHVEGGDAPQKFELFGRVAKLRKKSVTIVSWAYPGSTELCDDNTNHFCILRSAITRVDELHLEEPCSRS